MTDNANPGDRINEALKRAGIPTPSSDAYREGYTRGEALAGDLEHFAREYWAYGQSGDPYERPYREGMVEGMTTAAKKTMDGMAAKIEDWEWADANAAHDVSTVWEAATAWRIGAIAVALTIALSETAYHSNWARWGLVGALALFGLVRWLPKQRPSAKANLASLERTKALYKARAQDGK